MGNVLYDAWRSKDWDGRGDEAIIIEYWQAGNLR